MYWTDHKPLYFSFKLRNFILRFVPPSTWTHLSKSLSTPLFNWREKATTSWKRRHKPFSWAWMQGWHECWEFVECASSRRWALQVATHFGDRRGVTCPFLWGEFTQVRHWVGITMVVRSSSHSGFGFDSQLALWDQAMGLFWKELRWVFWGNLKLS
jgi:hypothetical protein